MKTFNVLVICTHNSARSILGEACPVWPGHPATAHWGIAELAQIEPPDARRAAFGAAYNQLARRIAAFLKLPRETMSTAAIVAAAREIREQAGQ
ncbi:MAG: hypothetical protein IPN75_00970 [Dechloromonas sp.]|mgnify:FL=1|jgi:arsenate reductase|uniref:Protein-tyrosine-phosphatase n=1 Tax=Candidatus Dechloromonas phosphorivorans TaxID=2899244 RepID=A0A9D7LMG0_9RHOO|nr:hypothetical protein [Candidatus Dechloromonas phosphorivorans]